MDFYRVKGCVVCAVLIFGMYNNNLNDFFFRIHNVYCVCLCLCMYWKWMNAVRVCWQCYNEKKNEILWHYVRAEDWYLISIVCDRKRWFIWNKKNIFQFLTGPETWIFVIYVDVGVLIKSQTNINVEGNIN